MDDRSRNVAVGLTTAVALAGLLAMMLLFGYVPGWVEGGYTVRVLLPNAAGLTADSGVALDGINVGRVKSVQFAPEGEQGVVVHTRIRHDVTLPESVRVNVSQPILGGSPSVQFQTPPDAPVTDDLPTDGSAVVRGGPGGSGGGVASEMRAMLEPAIADIHRVAEQFEALSLEWAMVGQNVNQLIEPRSPEAVDRGEAASNLSSVIARTDARLAELERVLEGLEAYTEDQELRENIREAAANARRFSESLPDRADVLTANVNTSIDALRSQYVAVADDLSGVVQSMDRLVTEAREGEGTLGQLVSDPTLYDNLNDTVQRLQGTLDELRLLIEKWEAEGVPVQF